MSNTYGPNVPSGIEGTPDKNQAAYAGEDQGSGIEKKVAKRMRPNDGESFPFSTHSDVAPVRPLQSEPRTLPSRPRTFEVRLLSVLLIRFLRASLQHFPNSFRCLGGIA